MTVRPDIIHLPWNQSLLASAVEWLLADVEAGVPDMRDRLLLLPTRQAGRRLHEALAWELDQRGGALFPPMTATPWHLVRPTDETATELACLWQWIRVLGNLDFKKYKCLFPQPPEVVDFTWCQQMARVLHDLRGTLAEGGLDCAAVAEVEDCPEAARWRDLKKLEAAYRKALGGQVDVQDAKRQAAEAPVLKDGIKRVVVLGVPDLPVLVQRALEKLSTEGVSVEVVVFGPENGEALFDKWGRPHSEQWTNRELPLDDRQLISQLDEAAQATEISTRVKAYGKKRASHVAVGVADLGVTPRLERALADFGVPCFNPDGRPLRRAPLAAFLKALQAVLQQPSFNHADALLRMPDAWGWVRSMLEKFSPTRMQKGLDEIREEHLPSRLSAAARLHFEGEHMGNRIHARAALEQLEMILERIEKTPLSEGLVEFLQAAFGERNFTEGREEDAADLESARLFMARLSEWEAALGKGKRPAAAEALVLLLDIVGREAVFPERPADAVDIQGWLELAWEDAPHLIVAGINEGHLPESIRGDRFLPDTMRARLGLRTNADRFARDAWLMELLLNSRMDGGRVDFLVGRQRASGEPLKPSRLLFRCPDGQLAKRVEWLFAELPPGPQPPAWKASWPLRVDAPKPVEKLSPTGIKTYLACPYRFYLRQALRMEPLDVEQRELNALGFGSLVHNVLDAFGQDEKARKMRDADAIHKFFDGELQRQVAQNFGASPPLSLQVQQQIVERRLYQVALVQAGERADGWEIIGSERTFERKLDGLLIRGRIDRIDRNADTGAIRVLDYKTSNTAKTPAQTHWAMFDEERDGEEVPEYARIEIRINNRNGHRRWVDLQLPLYAWALETEFGPEASLGYFNIPAVGVNTGVELLNPFDSDVQKTAMDCARGVVADVASGRFWPPTGNLKYDEYEGILFNQPMITALNPGEVTE